MHTLLRPRLCPAQGALFLLLLLPRNNCTSVTMTFRVGRVAVPIPRMLPLATVCGLFLLSVGIAVLTRRPSLPYVNVAFVGNSMMYYNDLPRLMERLGDGHIFQDSCLHGDATLSKILLWGNGMYPKWKTGNARDREIDRTQYDFGACTVPQLLFGYDADLETKVENANYKDDDGSIAEYKAYDDFFSYYDGSNPCLLHDNYYYYVDEKYASQYEENGGVPMWDFVVVNDNTRSPARYDERQDGLTTLENYFLPWFVETGATPILLCTYGYWTPYRDMGDLTDVPTFTSLTYEGYLQYAKLLEDGLPENQKPRIAKVGWAFLIVWEENQELWNNLFHVDKIHASPAGTYLEALVVYHTIFGRMPPREISLRKDTSSMWDAARRFAPPNHRRGRFPTPEEELYLYDVAVRICVYGLTPKTLIFYKDGEAAYYTPDDSPYRVDDLF